MAKHGILSAMVMVALGVVLTAGPVRAADAQLNTGSVKLVTWEIELPGGLKAKLTAASGEVVRLTRDDGSELAFIPEVALNSPVKIKVFEVAHEGAKESLRPVDVMEISPGEEAFSRNLAGLTLRLVPRTSGRPAGEALPKAVVAAPPSDMLIRWDLTLSTGRVVKVISREGEMTRLKLQDGQSFGFVPTIREEGTVSFRVFSLARVKGIGQTLHPMETFDVRQGSGFFPQTLASSLVKVTDVGKISPADREALSKLLADPPGGDTPDGCCLTCSGTRVCGCAVSMDCGDCCMPPCCFLEF